MRALRQIQGWIRSQTQAALAVLERLGWLAPLPRGEELRAAFDDDGIARSNFGVRVLCAFAAGLLFVSAAYSRITESASFGPLLEIRSLALVAEAAIFWSLRQRLGREHPRELAVALTFVLSLTIHALARYTGGQESPQYDRLDLVVLGTAIAVTWTPGWQLLSCLIVAAVYVGGAALAGELHSPHFVPTLSRLGAVSLVSVAASAVRERMRWRQLWYVHELAEARRRVEQQGQRLNEELERRVQSRTVELRASEQRFRTMFDAAPIGVIAVDANGCLLQANRAFELMLDYGAEDLRGHRITDFVASEDRWRFLQVHTRLRAGGQTALPLDGHYVRRNGTPVATHEAVTAIYDASGGFAYALAMVEDDSERQRAEESARRHREQLAHVLRVSTMGEMAAQLAHELNQPLGAIVNFANAVSAILRNGGADAEVVAAVDRIAGEGLRAGEVIRRVREFVRGSAGPRPATDVNHLVRESIHLVEGDARRHGIEIRLDLDAELPAVRLDGIQVEQVILNLLRNAIEAMTAVSPGEHELAVRTWIAGDGSVEICVRDTGVGLHSAEGGRIFEAFYTTKAGGLGMGLSISRSIVEAHGGRLWAESNVGRGSTFSFALPASAVTEAAA